MPISGALKAGRAGVLAGVCAGLLAGCSWLGDWPPSGREVTQQAEPPPQARIMQTPDGTWIEPPKQESAQAQAKPVEQPQGYVYDKDARQRIEKLEREVAGIGNDLSTMMPAITKLAQTQGDIQKLLASLNGAQPRQQPAPSALEPSAGSEAASAMTPPPLAPLEEGGEESAGASTPIPLAPMPPPAAGLDEPSGAVPSAAFVPASVGAEKSVSQVRLGEHAGKTRLVFDVSDKVAYSYDLDNNEKLLTLTLPDARWNAPSEAEIRNSPTVMAYSASSGGGGGSQVTIQLRQPAKVLWVQYLPPSAGSGGRLVMDVAPE